MPGELEHLEIPSKSEANEFKQIKPEEGMNVKQARSFWDNLFSKQIAFLAETGNELLSDAIEIEDTGQETGEDNTSKETDKGKEESELTSEEINELQRQAIKDAFERIARGEKLTDAEKGNLGEMLMDQYYISKGYTPIHKPRVIDLVHKSGQGIDGVYEKTNPDGTKSYVIADAKVNHSQLSKGLADGTDQMSAAWIDKRLDDAVGKENADAIRDSYEDDPDSVSCEVYHFSYGETNDGSSYADVSTVDEKGNRNKDKELVQIFDSYGNDITGGGHND